MEGFLRNSQHQTKDFTSVEDSLCNLRVIFDLVVQVERELFSFFASFFLFSKESGGSPLTLRPNFNCKKGNVTAAAAACMPRRGIAASRR